MCFNGCSLADNVFLACLLLLTIIFHILQPNRCFWEPQGCGYSCPLQIKEGIQEDPCQACERT